MSILACRVPTPLAMISLAMVSMEVYDRLHSSLLIPSMTLAFDGEEKSTIDLHLPGLFFLGMIPIGLQWMFRVDASHGSISISL